MKEIIYARNFLDCRFQFLIPFPPINLCSLGGPEFVVASGVVLLYISAGLAVWSLVVYMSKIWKVLLR